VVRLRASKYARVHIFATRYQPAFSAFTDLAKVRDAELSGMIPGHADSVYLTGRNIGDEYRYVLDRKNQRKFPGNMLERPMVLLNPWAVRTTETGEQVAMGGDEFGKVGGVRPTAPVMTPPAQDRVAAERTSPVGSDFSNRLPGRLCGGGGELAAGQEGIVRVPPQDFGRIRCSGGRGRSARHDVALDAARVEGELRRSALKPDSTSKHFTQQKQVSLVKGGQAFTIADVVAAASRCTTACPKFTPVCDAFEDRLWPSSASS
jgi:hypothetical protein